MEARSSTRKVLIQPPVTSALVAAQQLNDQHSRRFIPDHLIIYKEIVVINFVLRG
jgi:hypothetical protein